MVVTEPLFDINKASVEDQQRLYFMMSLKVFFRMFIRSLCIQKQKTTFIKCYQLTVFFFRGLIFCIKLLKMNKGSIFFIRANIAF